MKHPTLTLSELNNLKVPGNVMNLKESALFLRSNIDDLQDIMTIIRKVIPYLVNGEISAEHIAHTPYKEILEANDITKGTLDAILQGLSSEKQRKILTHCLFVPIQSENHALEIELGEIAGKILEQSPDAASKEKESDDYIKAKNKLTNILIIFFSDIATKLRDGLINGSFFHVHPNGNDGRPKNPKQTRDLIDRINTSGRYSDNYLAKGSKLEYDPLLEFAIGAGFIRPGLADDEYKRFLNNAQIAFNTAKDLYGHLERGLAKDPGTKKRIKIDLVNEVTSGLWNCIKACFCSFDKKIQHHGQTLFMLTLLSYEAILNPTNIPAEKTTEKNEQKTRATQAVLDQINSPSNIKVNLYLNEKTGKVSLKKPNNEDDYTDEEELNCRAVKLPSGKRLILYVPDDLFHGEGKEKDLAVVVQKMLNQGLTADQVADRYRSQILIIGTQEDSEDIEEMTHLKFEDEEIKTYISNFFDQLASNLDLSKTVDDSRYHNLRTNEYATKLKPNRKSKIKDGKMYFVLSGAETSAIRKKRKLLKTIPKEDISSRETIENDIKCIYEESIMKFELRFLPVESYGLDQSKLPVGHLTYGLERLYETALKFIRNPIEPELFAEIVSARKRIEASK